jgi:hypothetical protein
MRPSSPKDSAEKSEIHTKTANTPSCSTTTESFLGEDAHMPPPWSGCPRHPIHAPLFVSIYS